MISNCPESPNNIPENSYIPDSSISRSENIDLNLFIDHKEDNIDQVDSSDNIELSNQSNEAGLNEFRKHPGF